MTHSIAGSEPTYGTRSVTGRSLQVLSVGVPLAPKLPHPVKLLLKGTEQDGIGGHDEVLFVVLRSASGPVVAAGKQSPIVEQRELVMHVEFGLIHSDRHPGSF